jgi:hypothetical protein
MKYLALIALVLAGCSQEPRQYGAPIPLVWNAATFDNPAPVFGAQPSAPLIIGTPSGGVICQRTSAISVFCS